ncbi:MAG: glutathione peroxidase [Acidobacteria bacterium]|nr:glutathione peroxidase [Acidobacteriota bacterium]
MTLYDIQLTTIGGESTTVGAYRGRVLLIVNVASRCGYTPQYAGLEALYRRHQGQGFCVLGFPCDQFGHQEPGDEAEIERFCAQTYDVTFPMFSKIQVNGTDAHPLYQHLKSVKKGLFGRSAIPWNFSKFLVGRNGDVVRRYSYRNSPEAIERDLVPLLG